MRRTFALAVAGWVAAAPTGAAQQPPPFAERVAADFTRWDTDRNGTLSAAELDAAVLNPKFAGPSAAALAAIKQFTAKPGTTPVPSLTARNLQALAAAKPVKGQPGVNDLYAYAAARIAAKDMSLFGTGRPRLDTIRQGTAGNCFALAAVGALVNRDALAVTRLFETRPAGEYRVAFPAGVTVTVAAFTDAELALAGSSGGDGRWVNVFEMAVAVAMNRADLAKSKAVALDSTAAGGDPAVVLGLLTGHATKDVMFRPADGAAPLPTAPVDARKALAAVRDGKLAVAASPGDLKTPGLKPQHAYAVLAFDPVRDEVKLWDPHGDTFKPTGRPGPATGYPTAAGTFSVPVPEFAGLFLGLVVETAAPARKAK